MIGIDPGTVALGLGSLGSIVAALWAWLNKQRRAGAETRADVAESDAAKSRAEASETVFSLVTQRLTQVEKDLSAVRLELTTVQNLLRERDNKIHGMEMHIKDLEHVLTIHGIVYPQSNY